MAGDGGVGVHVTTSPPPLRPSYRSHVSYRSYKSYRSYHSYSSYFSCPIATPSLLPPVLSELAVELFSADPQQASGFALVAVYGDEDGADVLVLEAGEVDGAAGSGGRPG